MASSPSVPLRPPRMTTMSEVRMLSTSRPISPLPVKTRMSWCSAGERYLYTCSSRLSPGEIPTTVPPTALAPRAAASGSPGQAPVTSTHPARATAPPSASAAARWDGSMSPDAAPITPTLSAIPGQTGFDPVFMSHLFRLLPPALLAGAAGTVPGAHHRAAVPGPHMAVLTHLLPHPPVRLPALPASPPVERVPLAPLATHRHPAVADVPAPRPVGVAVEPAARPRRVGGRRVGHQFGAVVPAAHSDRLLLDRPWGLQVLVPGVDHQLPGVGVGQEFGVGSPVLDRHHVAAVGPRRWRGGFRAVTPHHDGHQQGNCGRSHRSLPVGASRCSSEPAAPRRLGARHHHPPAPAVPHPAAPRRLTTRRRWRRTAGPSGGC